MYRNYIKRSIDILVSLLLLLILSPIMVIITLLLLFANKGKPFFIHPRPGKGERIFYLLKFKTMNDKTDANGELLHFQERITQLGSILRKSSLDELPQLINVLKGEMSLIGPRPLMIHYLPLYNKTQKRRHEVRPGITGWAQVHGRNAISWTQKFEYDVWYVDNITFVIDLRIILLTIKKVFKREGINFEENVITGFTGNPED